MKFCFDLWRAPPRHRTLIKQTLVSYVETKAKRKPFLLTGVTLYYMSFSHQNKRNAPQTELSRGALIAQHVETYLRETSVSQMTCATQVREIYEQLPETQRTIEWSQRSDCFDRAKRDAEKLFRYFHKQTLPIDLEDAIVMALPNDRRDVLEYELSARRGRVSVRTDATGEISDAGLAKEVGEAIAAMGDQNIENKIKEFEEASVALQAMANQLKSVGGYE